MLENIDTWREFLPLAFGISALSALVVGIIIDYAEECIGHKPHEGGKWLP